MKQICLLATIFFISVQSFAAPVIRFLGNNNSWLSASSWDLNRLPMNGDTVVIPSGKILLIDNNINAPSASLNLQIFGTLKFTGNFKLNIGSASTIVIFSGGSLQASGSHSDLLKIGGLAVFRGDQGELSGPMLATFDQGAFVSFWPLPVKFLGFSLARKSNAVLVEWSTTEEINAGHFDIERSLDARSWSAVASLPAKGNSSGVVHYSFTDKLNTSSVIYYRIRQVDMDGKFVYTPVKTIQTNHTAQVNISSVQGSILVQFEKEIKGSVMIRLINLNGQVISHQSISTPVGQVILQSPVKGNLVVSVSNEKDMKTNRMVAL